MNTARILKDSLAPNGARLTTFEVTFPKFILAEFNTHRMISKNSASSRAIKFETLVSTIQENPVMPVWWGKNQPGMQADEELDDSDKESAKKIWLEARDSAIEHATRLANLGCHKQIVNRIIEPWMITKVVCSATEWDNFFHLRTHKDAQPEFKDLARKMFDVYSKSTPKQLDFGQWHIPYVDSSVNNGKQVFTLDGSEISLDDALILSASLCAQTSFRTSNDSLEKARSIWNRLMGSNPKHASPTEHQGTPSISSKDVFGNFRGWKQYRHTIQDNTCYKFTGYD